MLTSFLGKIFKKAINSMQICDSKTNKSNIFQALGNRDLKKLNNSSIKTKKEAFEQMQKLEFMEFKNQHIEDKGDIKGLGEAWFKHCLMVKNGEKNSPILAELFKNEGFIHQVFTKSAVRAFSLGYIYEERDRAFSRSGKFNITMFIDFIKKIDSSVASYILPRYLDSIEKVKNEVYFGGCKFSLDSDSVEKKIYDCYSFKYNGSQQIKKLNEEDNIVGLKKEDSTASEEEQGKLKPNAEQPLDQSNFKDIPHETSDQGNAEQPLDNSEFIDISGEISAQDNKSLDEKYKYMMVEYSEKFKTTSLGKEKLENFRATPPDNSMIILQQGLKNLGIVEAKRDAGAPDGVLFKGINGYEVNVIRENAFRDPIIKYEFIEIITPSNNGIKTKIFIMFNYNNAHSTQFGGGSYRFIRKELFNKDKYDLVMILDGSNKDRKQGFLERIGHFMPLIIDNKNNCQFAIDPKSSKVRLVVAPHPIHEKTINLLKLDPLSDSEPRQNKKASTFEEFIADMKKEDLSNDEVNFIKSKMMKKNFPVKAMNVQGAYSTNCVRLGAFISLEILVQYLDKQSIDLGAVTKHLNSFGESNLASIANLFIGEWNEKFTINEMEPMDEINLKDEVIIL